MVFGGMLQSIYDLIYELQPLRLRDITNMMVVIGQVSMLFLKALLVGIKALCSSAVNLSLSTVFICTTWMCGALISHIYVDTLSLYVMATLFALIFLNLGERKQGELSAYSVFNDGFEEILGTLNAKQFDREIRHADIKLDDNIEYDESDTENLEYYIPSDDDGDDEKLKSKGFQSVISHENKTNDEGYVEILHRRAVAKKVIGFNLEKSRVT